MSDPDAVRARHRELWERAASGWAQGRAVFDAAVEPVSRRMLDGIDPRPGQTVLELAAGLGATGFMAAPSLEPGGTLICTDGARAMVDAARERAGELGLGNVEFAVMELEWIDRETASVDAVLCRFGLMLAVDRDAAAREIRRVLRPGGRAAIAVWDVAEANPWFTIARDVLVEHGLFELPPPDAPDGFTLSGPGVLAELLQGAGFVAPEVTTVELRFASPDRDAAWDGLATLSPRLRDSLAGLAPAEHYRLRDAVDEAWSPYVEPGGSVALPGRALVALAEA